jgi:endonuclease/exonuclease/phosphatase family metal-dependent hydrolase
VKAIEPLQTRTVLHAQVKVGGKPVDLLDVHQSLAQTDGNTAQLGFLADLAARWEKEGRVVVAGGDFNTNFAITRAGKAEPKGSYETPTDTLPEYADRYRGWTPGNVADPANLAAVERLKATMADYWSADRRAVLTADGATTPEAARAALAARAPGSAAHDALLLAADGASHKGAHKRFDNVLVSRNARVTAATIDQTATGSDHQPVYADLAL